MTSNSSVYTDNVLQFVLKKFITLQDDDKKHYVKHYTQALVKLIDLMKENDPLFKTIYRRLYYAGSYYDGLKVGKPEEFDLDVVMSLPVNKKEIEFISKKVKPPFTTVKIVAMEQLKHHPEWPIYRHMDQWKDTNGMLLQLPFRKWMESVINKALNTLPKENPQSNAKMLDLNGEHYLITLKKTGPAMTFNITIPDGTKLDVDFVPVFEFQQSNNWPPPPIRVNPIPSKDTWFIVPKPNSRILDEYNDTYWRLAFHDQEREMISGKNCLKPVCRLLKKLRDNNSALKSIASYYIKTLFLWDIQAKKSNPTYWSKTSLTAYFMSMLKMLQEKIKEGKISYFWDDRYDLLSGMSDIEKSNCLGRLNKIIKEIENKSNDDPKIIAKYILTPEEFRAVEEVEFFRSSSVASDKEIQLPVLPTNVTKNPTEVTATGPAPNGTTLEMIAKLLASMQNELLQQKKLTQTVLSKVCILQGTVDNLTDDNARLRDELKLTKLRSRDRIVDTTTRDLLTPLDSSYESVCAVPPLINFC